jgi:hypothetical protein
VSATPEPVDYATVQYLDPDGNVREFTDLTRLTDGRVMCCLCFAYTPRSDLAPDPDHPGCVIDVCQPCAAREAGDAP